MSTIIKIAVVGPESTGKSTLCSQLAKLFDTVWVPEFARQYIGALRKPYVESDLINIALGQLSSENALARQANRFLFCDTNLLVLKVWSEHKYGRVGQFITSELGKRKYDFYLLTNIDMPWEDDPQREHPEPEMRTYFLNWYERLIKESAAPYIMVSGSEQERLQQASAAINKQFP